MGTPIYMQVGDSGQRYRIGEISGGGPIDFAQFLREVADELREVAGAVEPEPRWFRDAEGYYWYRNDDGTLTWMYTADTVGLPGDVDLDHVPRDTAERRWGPLTACEAPS